MLNAGVERIHTSTAFQVMGIDKTLSYQKKE